jgi:hypothetical protein
MRRSPRKSLLLDQELAFAPGQALGHFAREKHHLATQHGQPRAGNLRSRSAYREGSYD